MSTPCLIPFGSWNDCPRSASGHLCVRPEEHEGRCRCDCGATTSRPDPIFIDPQEFEEAQELLDD